MNCSLLRQRLLESESPDRPGASEARHLARCADCRAWQVRLTRLEQLIPQLPVPTSAVPPALQRRPLLVVSRRSGHPSRRQSALHAKLALSFSLAATLALFTLGYWAWPHQQPADPKAGLSQRSYSSLRDERIKVGETPRQRMAVLANLADDILTEARQLSQHPDRLEMLADHYDRLLREDLLGEARRVNDNDRAIILVSLAEKIRRAESEASRVASEWRMRHPRSARQLQRIAATAAAVDLELRQLAQA